MEPNRGGVPVLAACLVLVGAGLVTFLPTWGAPFAEDDYVYLDAVAGDGSPLRWFAREGVLDHHYRPLSDPLFLVVAPTAPIYHAWLQALHVTTACLLFLWTRRLGCDPLGGAWLGALLYVSRDFTFPSMVWASGVSDLAPPCLILAALYGYTAWLDTRSRVARTCSVLAWVGALLFKETAVVGLALFPLAALLAPGDRADRSSPAWRRALTGQGPYWAIAVPIAAVQLALASFDDVYGREIYSLRFGTHTLGLWPIYWAWSFVGVREVIASGAGRICLYVFVGAIVVFTNSRARTRGGQLGIAFAVVWFTAAISPALLTPNRVVTSYLSLAAAGPCVTAGFLLASGMRHARRTVRGVACAVAIVLLLAGPALVWAKHRALIDPGGWVDPAGARRMAALLEELATEVVPNPEPRTTFVVSGEPQLGLTVLAKPDGGAFGPHSVLASAIRWRYARSDLDAVVIPPFERAPAEALEDLRVALRGGAELRVQHAVGPVIDLTESAREAARRGSTTEQFRRALERAVNERRSRAPSD